jgi:hypothetical protein
MKDRIATCLTLTAMILLVMFSGYTVSFSRGDAASDVIFYVH